MREPRRNGVARRPLVVRATPGRVPAWRLPPGPSLQAAASDGSKPRVLVLDDEPAIRAFLAKALRLAGFEPVAVADGQAAIEASRETTFEAVLVDHRMPGMSGTDVFAAVTAERPELASRFIFMSGDVLNPELRKFATEYHVGLLAKPFDVDTVNRMLAEVVGTPNE